MVGKMSERPTGRSGRTPEREVARHGRRWRRTARIASRLTARRGLGIAAARASDRGQADVPSSKAREEGEGDALERRERDSAGQAVRARRGVDRKSTRLNSSHEWTSYA